MKKLSKVELVALRACLVEEQKIKQLYEAAVQQKNEIMQEIGLEPGVSYDIGADGSVSPQVE